MKKIKQITMRVLMTATLMSIALTMMANGQLMVSNEQNIKNQSITDFSILDIIYISPFSIADIDNYWTKEPVTVSDFNGTCLPPCYDNNQWRKCVCP